MKDVLACKELKMTVGGSMWFISAAFLRVASASSVLPWESNHRGDSGMNLQQSQQEKSSVILENNDESKSIWAYNDMQEDVFQSLMQQTGSDHINTLTALQKQVHRLQLWRDFCSV